MKKKLRETESNKVSLVHYTWQIYHRLGGTPPGTGDTENTDVSPPRRARAPTPGVVGSLMAQRVTSQTRFHQNRDCYSFAVWF